MTLLPDERNTSGAVSLFQEIEAFERRIDKKSAGKDRK